MVPIRTRRRTRAAAGLRLISQQLSWLDGEGSATLRDVLRMSPLDRLEAHELVLLLDILKDACRERLEKNLTSQAFEERLTKRRGPVAGRIDPRPALKRWEPRYRKLLELGEQSGVTPLLEVWGFSKTISQLGGPLCWAGFPDHDRPRRGHAG